MEAARLREALRKQGIYVHESDPVLEMAAICQIAVADAVKAIEGLNMAAADRISAASAQHIEASKQSAAGHSSPSARASGRPIICGETANGNFRLDSEGASAGSSEGREAAAQLSVRIAWVTGSVGAIALAGLAGFLLAGLGHG